MKEHIKQNKGKYISGSLVFIASSLVAINTILDEGEELIKRFAKAEPQIEKREFERPESSVPEYVEYKDRTTFLNKADNINKQEN